MIRKISNLKYYSENIYLKCREPGAEQKFKEISNAYEVEYLILIRYTHFTFLTEHAKYSM